MAPSVQPEARPTALPGRGLSLPLRWGLSVLALLALAIIVGLAYSQFNEYRGRRNLVEARALLDALVFEQNASTWKTSADRAERLLKSAMQSSRRQPAMLLKRALDASRGGRVHSQEILRICDPSCETADLTIATLLFFKANQISLADKLATLALERGDERPRALQAATVVAYQLGRDEDVVRYATEWAEISPKEVMPWQYLAFVAEDRGYWEEAIQALRNQMDRTTGSTEELRRRLIAHLIRVGDATEARRELTALKTELPAGANDVSLLEARLLFLEGRLDETERILQEGRFTADDQVEVSLLRARLQMEQARFADAASLLKECVRKAASNQDAHYLLGQALARLGKADEAQQSLKTHRQLQDLKVRIHALERQAGQQPKNAEVRQTLADLYRQIGLEDQANLWQDAARAAQQ
jgi:predicted Zn-dependent protease